MKYRGVALFVMAGFIFTVSNAYCADKLTSSESVSVSAAKEASAQPKPVKVDERKIKKIRELVEEKKKELNGSEWKVTTGTNDPKVKGGPDVLTFQNSMVSQASFAKRGFGPTNYTISVPSEESEIAIFETMQTGKEGIIFIRGEWKKDTMQGVINEQLEGGKVNRSWWFSSNGRTSVSPTSEPEASAEVVAESAGASQALSSVEKSVADKASAPMDTPPSSKKADSSKKDNNWF